MVIQESQPTMQTVRQSSSIGSESLLNLLLAACQRAEEEAEAGKGDNTSSQESSDVENDHTSLPHAIFVDENL